MSAANPRPKTKIGRKKVIITQEPSPDLELKMVRLRILHSQSIHRFKVAIENKRQIEVVIASRRGHVVVYPISIKTTDDTAGYRGDSFRFMARLHDDSGIIVSGYVEGDSGWIEVPQTSPDRQNPRF